MLAHKDILTAELCFPVMGTAEQWSWGFYLLLGAFPFQKQYPSTLFCFLKEAFTHLKSFHRPRSGEKRKGVEGYVFVSIQA